MILNNSIITSIRNTKHLKMNTINVCKLFIEKSRDNLLKGLNEWARKLNIAKKLILPLSEH